MYGTGIGNNRILEVCQLFLASACIYDELYPLEGQDPDEKDVEATVQVIFGIGWTPHESQQKPDERGSATRKIGDITVDKSSPSQSL